MFGRRHSKAHTIWLYMVSSQSVYQKCYPYDIRVNAFGTLFVLKVKLIQFLDSDLTNVPFLFSVRKLIITRREFRH